MPKVSVVLPVFNAAATIARAVQSILNQTLRDIELIVVDDGSTDDTVDIVQQIKHETNDARLKLNKYAHRGVAGAANSGTELAQAPLIARMDADDFAYSTRLQKQLRVLHERNLDVVGCQVHILDASLAASPSMRRYQRWINQETGDESQILALRFVELPLVNPTILARRRYFELGFHSSHLPEDYDLLLRAANQGMRFGKVNEVLLDWTDHPHGLTRTDARYSPAAFMRCRRLHLLHGPLRNVNQVDLWGVGQTGKPWLRWLQTEDIAVRRAYDVSQRRIGARIHGVQISHSSELTPADGVPLIIAVGAEGARQKILPQLQSRNYVVGADAWFVA